MAKAKNEYKVEELYIEQLKELGYDFVNLKNYDDVRKNFRKQFCELNKEELISAKRVAELSNAEFERVLGRLENHTVYESAKILREKWILQLDNGKSIYVVFFTNNCDKNIYQVTHQVTMDKEHKEDVLYKNRYDVTILVNGLPLVQTELKRPGIEINEAVNQINRYRRFSFRGLFRFIQIFIISNSTMTKYCANINENDQFGHKQDILKSLTFFWTDENNVRINELTKFTNVFTTKFHLTEMLDKYFIIKDSEPVLLVMRPYQVYAVKRAFDRIVMSDMNGYVYHTTGSGKTLTSFKLASLLRDDRRISKVFFLIDRRDLDDQTVDEYNSFQAGCVDQTDSTKQLIKDLQDSTKKLVITTIQKMANALRSPKYVEIMDRFKTQKCVFIIDECHRSQFGTMHGQIRKHFEKSKFIGFTGTPIYAVNKGADGQTTDYVFAPTDNYNPLTTGKTTLASCIHKYMIKDAIADGNVLRFSVEYMRSLSLTNLKNLSIDANLIDDAEYCRLHNIDLEELYHSDERIASISDDILGHLCQHTRLNNNNVYTAIFAIDRIETLMKYYNYMKQNNRNNYKIAAIFTYQPNQSFDGNPDQHACEWLEGCMQDYNKMFNTDYDITKFDGYRRDISKRMKQKDLPQVDLLLVVNMFLTGFDSKATNTLFLDKNLVWHSLVQAYSRTNRVDKVTKQFGQIITYRNIKKAQDEALRLYSDGDAKGYLLESYEFYVASYRKEAEALRTLVATPEEVGKLQSENDIRSFILAFRTVAGTLSILKTFSKFDWADLDIVLDEDTYSHYKSYYLHYYDEQKILQENTPGRENDGDNRISVLEDVDFNIELIRTDKINVVYILNLLKDAKQKMLNDTSEDNKEEIAKSVDLVLREIERSDNEKFRYKRDVMKKFIEEKFFTLSSDSNISEAYSDYEKEMLKAEIKAFSKKNGLSFDFINGIVYENFSNTDLYTEEMIRQKLIDMGITLGLKEITKLINAIFTFLKYTYIKFTSEDK